MQYSICVFEALIWLKCLTEKQQQFVNKKTFSIFVVGKQSEKVFEYQTEKRRSTRRKRKNYCFDLGRLKRKRIKNNREMRKFLTLLAMIAISASVFAQKEVTKFLGIPVDGSPTEMIKKLKAKGFTTDEKFMQPIKQGLIDWDGPEVLAGRFNGERVRVLLGVETNKVWRIYLEDKDDRDETQIKIRFNTLVRQFEGNGKYVPYYVDEQTIADDEDISYQITVNKKQYQALFLQKGEDGTVDEKRFVWFTISQRSDGYCIFMFYDNEYNKADGSDL